MSNPTNRWEQIKAARLSTIEARCAWIDSMSSDSNADIIAELRQAMIDVMDLVEQSDEQGWVIAAVDAFDGTKVPE